MLKSFSLIVAKNKSGEFEIAFLHDTPPAQVGDIETDPRTVEMKARVLGFKTLMLMSPATVAEKSKVGIAYPPLNPNPC